MTKDELYDLVVSNVGRTDKGAVIDTALDFALVNISQIGPFLELRKEYSVSAASSVLSVQLPDEADDIVEIRLLDPASPTVGYPMRLIRRRLFLKNYPNVAGQQTSGRPWYCSRDGNVLYFDTTTNQEYTVLFTAATIAVFASGNSKVKVKTADECLVAYATGSVYQSIQMYQDAVYWLNRYGSLLQQLINFKEAEVGTEMVAREYKRPRDNVYVSATPWLDPFAGLSN